MINNYKNYVIYQINLILAFVNPIRFFNLILVYSSYLFSKIRKKPIQWGLPISFSIEPTTSCNLRCPQCPSGLRSFSRPIGMLNKDVYENAITQLSQKTGYVTFYFQGEPYLNKSFLEMVKFANQKNLFTVTSSNGHYLDKDTSLETVKSGLKKIIISIDGTTQETYEQYRIGGNLEKVLTATKNIIEAKKELNSATPLIQWQFIVFKHNEHQIDDIISLSKENEVDELSFKTAQIYDFENGEKWIPENKKLSRYIKKEDKMVIKNKLLNHCWRLWSGCVITWDGNVVPCCFDKDATYQLGNVNQSDFNKIWFGNKYQIFRTQLIKGRKNIDICQNCTEGTKVWNSLEDF